MAREVRIGLLVYDLLMLGVACERVGGGGWRAGVFWTAGGVRVRPARQSFGAPRGADPGHFLLQVDWGAGEKPGLPQEGLS